MSPSCVIACNGVSAVVMFVDLSVGRRENSRTKERSTLASFFLFDQVNLSCPAPLFRPCHFVTHVCFLTTPFYRPRLRHPKHVNILSRRDTNRIRGVPKNAAGSRKSPKRYVCNALPSRTVTLSKSWGFHKRKFCVLWDRAGGQRCYSCRFVAHAMVLALFNGAMT